MTFDPLQILRPDWRAGDGSALLRPWWGTSPGRLLVRAVVQGAVAVVLMVVALRVRSGEYLPDDAALGDSRSTISAVALAVVALAVLWLLFSLLRIAVGILDLIGRTETAGVVVSITERPSWGFLPGIVQGMLWNRRDQGIDRRREHLVLTIATDRGQRSWKLTPGKSRGVRPGDMVRVIATPINGYVRLIETAGAQ